MTRPARILYIGVGEEDFTILAQYCRPAAHTEIRTLALHDLYNHPERQGELVDSFGEWKADAIIYSPSMAHPVEIEELLEALLSQEAP